MLARVLTQISVPRLGRRRGPSRRQQAGDHGGPLPAARRQPAGHRLRDVPEGRAVHRLGRGWPGSCRSTSWPRWRVGGHPDRPCRAWAARSCRARCAGARGGSTSTPEPAPGGGARRRPRCRPPARRLLLRGGGRRDLQSQSWRARLSHPILVTFSSFGGKRGRERAERLGGRQPGRCGPGKRDRAGWLFRPGGADRRAVGAGARALVLPARWPRVDCDTTPQPDAELRRVGWFDAVPVE